MSKYKKKSISKSLKNNVWDTYIGPEKGQTECYTGCGTIINSKNFECGHIEAESKGGSTNRTNLRPICSTCNKSMGSKNMKVFIKDNGYNCPYNDNSFISINTNLNNTLNNTSNNTIIDTSNNINDLIYIINNRNHNTLNNHFIDNDIKNIIYNAKNRNNLNK